MKKALVGIQQYRMERAVEQSLNREIRLDVRHHLRQTPGAHLRVEADGRESSRL